MAFDPNKFQNFFAAAFKVNMHRFAMFPASFGLSWIDGATVGGESYLGHDDFSSLLNGVLTVFSLSFTPGDPDSAVVYWNGLRLRRGTDYTLSGTTLTTTGFVGGTGDSLLVDIFG